MTKLLITGSRDANMKMLDYAKKVVARAKELGYSIIVGDAEGIDSAVISAWMCTDIPIEVHGANNQMRISTSSGINIKHPCSYIERDRIMARECDLCVAIWNGKSKGTRLTYDYAKSLGKECYIKIL